MFIGKKTLQVNPKSLEPQLAVLLREPAQRVLLIESKTRKIVDDMLALILVPTSIVDPFNNLTELAEELELLEMDSYKLTKTTLLENTLPQGLSEVITLECLEKHYNTIKLIMQLPQDSSDIKRKRSDAL